jgi:hypothetical protein
MAGFFFSLFLNAGKDTMADGTPTVPPLIAVNVLRFGAGHALRSSEIDWFNCSANHCMAKEDKCGNKCCEWRLKTYREQLASQRRRAAEELVELNDKVQSLNGLISSRWNVNCM